MRRILLIFVAVLAFGTAGAHYHDRTAAIRKKVAVVLSGGGAKGMAHIGVLKVLEKAGIPIDIVTGTSMGSIVGGFYCIGYNATALDSIVRVLDWSYVITDKENLGNQSLSDRKKQNTYIFSSGMALGKKRNVNSGGFIKGKNLAELFQQLCRGFTDSLNFTEDLPIPFACVATDIVTNTEVVFHSGRLPQAMRASMAIPAVFSPVRMGDMVLVDGCLRNNYPVDVAREMGADVVIGITLSGKPKTAKDITGTMSVLGQIIDNDFNNKYEENIALTDLHINIDPRDYTAASFSAEAIDSLVRYGEEETMRHWDEIIDLKKRIGLRESYRPAVLHPMRPLVMTEKHKISGYTFENMSPQDERFLRQKFHLNRIDSIDARLEQQLTTSMRVDLFYQTAECRLVPENLPKGRAKRLVIRGVWSKQEKEWAEADGVHVILSAGPRKSAQLHAGVRYDTEEYAALQLGLDIPLRTSIPVNTDVTLRLGKRLMISGDLTIHPRSFTRPTLSYAFRRNDVDVYSDGDLDYNIRYNQFQVEFTPVNFDFRHFNVQIGLRWDYMHYRNRLGAKSSDWVSPENERFYSYRARVEYNSEDDWHFPTRGARFKAEYAYLTDNFAKIDDKPGMSDVNANWRMSFSFGKHFTLQPMVYGRLLFGTTVPPVFSNTIGGDWFGHYVEQQMPFAGIGNMEYVDNQFVAAQLQGQLHIGGSSYVLLRASAAQQANQLEKLMDYHTLLGGQVAYYYNTPFGPAGATFGYSNRTKSPYLFVNLGYEF